MHHLAGCQQLSVVVAATDICDEAVDASPDVNGIVHDLPEMMTARSASGTRICPSTGAEKARKGQRASALLSVCSIAIRRVRRF